MTISLSLSQEDRNRLIEEKIQLQKTNELLNDSNKTNLVSIAEKLKNDISFKKQTDSSHFDIYLFEEELRRLNGLSLPQPLQEQGFVITNYVPNTRLFINNGRLAVKENSTELVNVPIIPFRGYSWSSVCGTNFDIWTVDRKGSTTSKSNLTSTFTLDIDHSHLRISVDGLETELDIGTVLALETDEQISSEIFTNSALSGEIDFVTLHNPVRLGSTSAVILRDVTTIDSNEISSTESLVLELVEGIDYSVDSSGNVHFIERSNPDEFYILEGDQIEFSYDYIIQTPQTVSGLIIASSLQSIANNIVGFENVSISFYDLLNTFTVTSGTGGQNSTAIVLDASSNDMKNLLGFDIQRQISGKFQNNLLNVEIDGIVAEIEISDFRKCENDVSLGNNNDESGIFWSSTFELGYYGRSRVGPLFCSGINNGNEVAESIQAKLREVGSGGFKDALCFYFDEEQTFIIYSGTFGQSSSVHVLPTSDPLRDARTMLGFNPFKEEKGNEIFYGYLDELVSYLSNVSNISITGLTDPDRLSHSIIYLPENGVKFSSDWQDLIVVTSKIYDDGSKGLPRLYLDGKVIVDSTNDKINFFEKINVEKTAVLEHGTYSEGELIKLVIYSLNLFGESLYTGDYDSVKKKFWIKSDITNTNANLFSLLWNSGKDSIKSIGLSLGFSCLSDKTSNLTYWSDNQISFSSTDFFYPNFCSQFYGNPMLIDDTVDEKSAILKEEEELNDEINLLTRMKLILQYDNENLLNCWEQLTLEESENVDQQYTALRIQRGCYGAHISEIDSIINQQTTELTSLIINKNNLNLNSQHCSILNRNNEQRFFIHDVDFTKSGNEQLTINVSGGVDRKIYNNFAPFVKYDSELKTIPGRFTVPMLFNISNTFIPEQQIAFKLKNSRTGTKGFSYSSEKPSGLFSIVDSDTSAILISTNSEMYYLTEGDTLQFKIDGGITQTAVIDATPGYVESRIITTDCFVIKTLVNDSIDFVEGISNLSTFLTQGIYTGSQLATEIQNKLNAVGNSNYVVDYNALFVNKFTISSDGFAGSFSLNFGTGINFLTSVAYTIGFNSVNKTGNSFYSSDVQLNYSVISNVNDNFSIKINEIYSANQIIIPQGQYLISNLITVIQNQIANDPNFNGSDFLVSYVSNKFRIYSTRKGNTSTVDIYGGTNDFLRTLFLDGDIPVVGGGDVGNIKSVTATEIANILNVEISGITATNFNEKVKIQTNSADGSVSSIEVVGGSAITIIGFPISVIRGTDKNNMLKVNIDSNSTNNSIYLTGGNLIDADSVRFDIQTKLRLVGSGGYTNAICTWNEITTDFNYTNRFRILSGTYGSSSNVLISDLTIYIQTGINDSFDFEESSGIKSFIVPQGFYNGFTLSQSLNTLINVSGNSNYVVTYTQATNKLTISSDGSGGIFNLRFATGPNNVKTIAKILGFYKKDYTSFLTYINDGFVKVGDVKSILGYDLQTSESGHNVVDVFVGFNGNLFYTDVSLDTGGGIKREIEIDTTVSPNNNILGLINSINNYFFSSEENFYNAENDKAFLLGRICEKFSIVDNDELKIEANGNSKTVSFSCTRGVSFSGLNACTRIYSGINDQLTIDINGIGQKTIVLGTLLSGQKIADKIQQKVRVLYDVNIENYAAYLDFYCYYSESSGQYSLYSGTGGTGSTVKVYNSLINDAAQSLRLGITNSGNEIDGTGDVVNSKFVSLVEIVNKLNDGAVGYICSGTNYLKIQSTEYGINSRIKVSGSLLVKLGFDYNNDDYPNSYLSTVESQTIQTFSNISIKDPIEYKIVRGYEISKGDITISFYSIDDQNIDTRLLLIPQRIANIIVRKSQIDSRISNVINSLVPSLYQKRIDAVKVRLNKKTGSYVKVGDEFKQKENSESMIQSNNDQIVVIDSLL